ncbi:aminodeoxychorismate synthase component I [Variovorax sp. NFACC27]|uniref:aminodeoxychorismate synthase n=1 Tax=Variovorax gossypii TaxID=1679495 RepID=A0A3S0JUI9_9BURK|nr:aminodeoxychorismate synthase component I [Variovorax gossypii]SEF35148.1 para-aminobenzoate synthetase [Variovorax sp. NFACC28]SEG98832.1 para-aminobenzoate synthetase [Variovorax sp. NFACC29]SFE13947.1 para-aminobenzoate synthetase [Variovorax sp. NFACC26]SFH19868.1 para-aminobenzoate synthetase [Variovorax sp. NFACC27]RTQ33020.1 aminodeoxychorismate synthase component I [Variovorax gossypii]
MRTLLIDNHDSFTYNLYQYLAACNAEPPVVVRNDEMSWDEVERMPFDNIVISPGPGRPQHPADLGISADALQRSRKPVLGVCLGHQAIAHHCGAHVDLAVRPMHGRLDRISHAQRDLFQGIPDRFEAVRYHSLAVTQLPASLEPLAWTSDGTLMALRHLSRPWWGVQFHPESICTEFGARLLRNFRELTQEWHAQASRREARHRLGPPLRLEGPQALALHAECIDTTAEPEAVFMAAFAPSDSVFWLDSSLAETGRARFSFMGDASGPRALVLTYRTAPRELLVHRGDAGQVREESIFDYLRDHIPGRQPDGPNLPFDFAGGFVGYFGYELKRELDGARMHDADAPDATWILADRFLAFDHAEQQAWIVCLDEAVLGKENARWMRAMRECIDNARTPARDTTADAASDLHSLQWRVDLNTYRDLILRCQHEILQGETYEVCLTNQLIGEGRIDPLEVYRALRKHNPAPYAAYLRAGGRAVLCASPELFLHISADRHVESKPIKGTAARGATPAEDLAIAEAMVGDEKTRAENLMIVDLLRNDLNRVCEIDSVHVPSLFAVETYATVHQLVSTIRGRLRPGLGAVDCVRAAFPGGSMTGAPKVRTMRILDEIEGAARGIYSGSIGYLSLNGAAQLNIVIRTLVAVNGRISIGAGGAIVAMSDPDAEVEEIVLKAQALWDVLRRCGAPLGPRPGTAADAQATVSQDPTPLPPSSSDG